LFIQENFSKGHLQPLITGLKERIRDSVVVGDSPGERGGKRGPGPHVGGMSGDTSDGVTGIITKMVQERLVNAHLYFKSGIEKGKPGPNEKGVFLELKR